MQIAQIHDELTVLVRDLDVDTFDADGARDALAMWGRVGRLAAAATASLAKRIDDLEAWKTQGAHSGAQAVARELGTSVAAAKEAIATAANVEWLPQTLAALLSGDLSVQQAGAIAAAAVTAPDQESALLDVAKVELLSSLKKKCGEVRLRAESGEDAVARRHASRRVVFGEGEPGMQHWDASVPNVIAGEIRSVWDCPTERAYRQARAEGRREPLEAYRVDGLLAMARAAHAALQKGLTAKPITPTFIIPDRHRPAPAQHRAGRGDVRDRGRRSGRSHRGAGVDERRRARVRPVRRGRHPHGRPWWPQAQSRPDGGGVVTAL